MDDIRLSVSALPRPGVGDAPVEVVERKGLGHPDTIADALAEEFGIALCRAYRERFGAVLHHNVDKVLLRAGASQPAFGGGRVVEPIEIYLAGRATRSHRGIDIPVDEIARATARDWLKAHLHALDADRDVRLHCLIRPGSAELVELFLRQQRSGTPLANDTSCGVGFAPQTPLERSVLAVEGCLNAADLKTSRPEIGEDVKVMGVRRGDELDLTVACAFVDRFVPDRDAYLAGRERVAALARQAAREGGIDARVRVNAGDDPDGDSFYLTVTGTSAEAGDDGQAGRGNRANGLITPYRPMTLESVAGKNPITHVGKLYNVAAREIAESLVAQIDGLAEAEVFLVSRIGRPVREPWIADARIACGERPVAELAPRVEEVVRAGLAQLPGLWERLLERALPLY